MKKPYLAEAERLIGLYLDECLEPEEFERLRVLLARHPECRELLCSEVLTESDLRQLGEVGAVLRLGTSPRDRADSDWSRKTFTGAMLAAAAVLVLLAVVLAFVRVRGSEPYATVRTSPHTVLQMDGPVGEREHSGQLKAGTRIKVAQGVAEIRLKEGVLCHVQAPASITLAREGLVVLEDGLARFEVERKEAQGFQVRTKLLQVVDLGTVFGVDCRNPDSPAVHVLEGEVVVSALHGHKESRTVKRGSAIALMPVGKLGVVHANGGMFPGALPSGIPAVRFTFDDVEDNILKGAGSLADRDGIALAIDHEDSPDLVAGRFGEALRFHGGNCRAETDWMGIGGAARRTISLWMRTAGNPEEEGQEISAMRMLGYGLYHGSYGMTNFSMRLSSQSVQQHICLYVGRRYLEGSTPLNDGEWHHVAIVIGDYSGSDWPATTIYVDGKAENITPRVYGSSSSDINPFNTRVSHPVSTPLTFGQYNPVYRSGGFRGELDEVIIVEGALTPDQVRALFEGRLKDSGIDLGVRDDSREVPAGLDHPSEASLGPIHDF